MGRKLKAWGYPKKVKHAFSHDTGDLPALCGLVNLKKTMQLLLIGRRSSPTAISAPGSFSKQVWSTQGRQNYVQKEKREVDHRLAARKVMKRGETLEPGMWFKMVS